MTLSIINYKTENYWWAALYDKETIFATGKTIKEANDNLESVISTLVLADADDGVNTFDFKPTSPELISMQRVIEFYQKEIIGQPIVTIYELNKQNILENDLKTERTNVTVVKLYKKLAKKRGINISEFLNQKLKEELKLSF